MRCVYLHIHIFLIFFFVGEGLVVILKILIWKLYFLVSKNSVGHKLKNFILCFNELYGGHLLKYNKRFMWSKIGVLVTHRDLWHPHFTCSLVLCLVDLWIKFLFIDSRVSPITIYLSGLYSLYSTYYHKSLDFGWNKVKPCKTKTCQDALGTLIGWTDVQ